MPKVSWDSATESEDIGPVRDRTAELDGYAVNFTRFAEDYDVTPLFTGLPGDRCQCPHWGYVVAGTMTVRFADRDEIYQAGEAFYTPPGHTPLTQAAGTEVVTFSPAEQLRRTDAVLQANARSARA